MFKKIALNTIISFATRILGVVIGIISFILTARLLGRQGLGLYSTALTWAYLISLAADLGLYNVLVRSVARSHGTKEEHIISNILTLRLVSLLFFLGTTIILSLFFPHLFLVSTLALTLASMQYFLLSVSQALMGIFQKYLRLDLAAVAEIAGRLVTLGGLAYLFYVRPDLHTYEIVLFAFVVGSSVLLAINIVSARRFVRLSLAVDISYWKELLRQMLPLTLSIIFTAIYFKSDTLFIAYFRNAQEVGLYKGAYQLLENLITFPAMFVGVLMPQFSQFAVVDREKFKQLFQGAFEALLMLTIPLVVAIAMKAESIMAFVGGGDFLASAGVLKILGLAIGLIYFGSLFSNALIALDLARYLTIVSLAGALFNVIANVLIIPRWGYIGAGVTTFLTEGLVTVLMIVYLERKLTMRLRFNRLAPILVATALMALFLLVAHVGIIVSVLGGMVVYVLALWAMGGLSLKELSLLMQG